ncbi:FxsA family protein [Corynebacterium freiburgense]|uniref:FxsA family protein n=1 Tax=Corynebacterium freiburgense TaxID=556548 RepID=UPI00040D6BA0|nr:FxsA family protein [Corynebacterium freiburgense]WJZ02601.1 phage T7 F exclusion suppressor FxsA [Corynebacterium freiburgense]
MPLIIAIPYIVLEMLAFWGIATWLGVGWALLLLVGCFFAGLFLAAFEMRRISFAATQGQTTPGKLAGDYGLLAAGSVLVALPGFVTTFLGVLLIIPPTRAIARKVLAKKLRARIEEMGVRSFVATSRYGNTYGSFIDADTESPKQSNPTDQEIQVWADQARPEDFK